MKKNAILALCLILVLSLFGSALAEGEPLRVAWWGSESSNAIYLGVNDMFIESTGIDTEPEYLSWDDYLTKMNTLSASHDLPDEFRTDYVFIKNYIDKGLLLDMTELVESGLIDMSKVPDSALSGGRINGGLYGINAGSNSVAMLTNAKLVEDAGMEPLTNESTWEEFEQWVLDFHEKTGLYGADLFSLRSIQSFRLFARAFEQEIFNEPQDGAGFDVEVFEKYLESVKRMHDAGATQNIAEVTVDIGKENYPFSKGEAATIFSYTDSATGYAELLQENYGKILYTIIPGTAAKKGMYIQPSQYLSISADTERVEDAAAYINFWCNDLDANLFINGRRGVPINTEIAAAVSENVDDISKDVYEYMAIVADYSSDLYAPDPAGESEVEAAFIDAFTAVMYGEMTPAEGAQTFVDNMATILAA
ncbi:MAG: carbohydrate ABC transporter substrate-binding protein [Clostridia bacterium]|nr:carbohydrate ABC transporter substrate-binding protein [Clostridia bacterium]